MANFLAFARSPINGGNWVAASTNPSATQGAAETAAQALLSKLPYGEAVVRNEESGTIVTRYERQPGAAAQGAATNADTSGATLVQLETEVNEVKAVLRTQGLLLP